MSRYTSLADPLRSVNLLALLAALGGCGGGGSAEVATGSQIAAMPETAASSTDFPVAPAQDVTRVAAIEVENIEEVILSVSQDKQYSTAAPVPAYDAIASASAITVDVSSIVPNMSILAAVATTENVSSYAVDAVGGSDSNVGTQASPWKSLAKLSSSKLAAGAQVYLRCGSVWRESLALGPSQLTDSVAIKPYGSNCTAQPPRITGADDFSNGWAKTGSIWVRNVPSNTAKITQLFVNGQVMRIAQWPNAGSSLPIVAANSTAGAVTTIAIDSGTLQSLKGQNVSNATIQIRTRSWLIETGLITSLNINDSKVNLAAPSSYAPEAGRAFVLQDKLWMLDSAGEFFHDTTTSKLYLYPPNVALQAALNGALVEGSVRSSNITLQNMPGMQLAGIRSDMAKATGVQIIAAPGFVIDGIDASKNGGAGVRIDSTNGSLRRVSVKNSRFVSNGDYGVYSAWSPGVDVSNNSLTNTGTAPYEGPTHAAIRIGANSSAVGNVIDGSGYHGIHFSGTGNSRVAANQIKNYCTRLPDCAGIYTWNGPKASRVTLNQTSVVENNTVWGATAATLGANTGGATIVAGIYLDDFSQGVAVRNNTVYDNSWGVVLHNASQNTIELNRLWAIRDAAIVAIMDQADADYMTGNAVQLNQIVPIVAMTTAFPAVPNVRASLAVSFSSVFNLGTMPLALGANRFAGNQIVMLQGQTQLPVASIRTASATTLYSAAQWQSMTAGDYVSQPVGTFRVYASQVGPELLQGGNFDSGVVGWQAYFDLLKGSGGSASLTTGNLGCTGPCIQLVTGSANDSVSSPTFAMRAGNLHTIHFTAGFNGAATIAKPNIIRAVSPWDSFVSAEGMTITNGNLGPAGSTLNFEAFFRPTSEQPARFGLRLGTIGVAVNFDAISVREVLGYTAAKTLDWMALASSTPTSSVFIDCPSLGWPTGCAASTVDGIPVSLPKTFAAGTSQLLVRTDSPWHQ